MGIYILCPYYKRDRKRSITCEDTIRLYPTPKEKNAVIKRHCASSWKSCPYASKMESVYSLDLPYEEIKEKIMENRIEEMEKEINKLMRENGQLQRKIKVYEEQIKERDYCAEKNHEMYMKDRRNKESLLAAKDKEIEWLESFAAAFLVVAYGEDTREVSMPKEKILKLMTQYQMSYKPTEDGQAFVFTFGKVKGEKS